MIQVVIVSIYILLTIGIGIFSKSKVKSSRNFDGSGLGLLMCVVASAGEWLGGTSTTGVAEYGYEFGIAGAWYTIANGVGVLVLAIFFARKFRSMNQTTVPGMVGQSLGNRSRIVSSALLLFAMVAVGISQMVAIATLGETLFGLRPTLSILVMGLAVLLYTVFGGMLAVGYTNIMHVVILYVGSVLAVLACVNNIGGLSTLHASLPESYFHMDSIGIPKVSSWLFASVFGACVAQAGLQPILGARDEKTAERASYLIALLVAPFGLLTALLGMYARVQFPGLESSKLALTTLIMSLNPAVGGLIMAALLAAVLSTASPIFLACGTLFTRDIYVRLRSGAEYGEDARTLRITRAATFAFGLLCIGGALLLHDSQRLLDIVYFAYSIRGSLFIILLLGMYWRKTSPRAANLAMLATSLVGLFWVVYKSAAGHYPIHPAFSETYAAMITALVFTVLGSFVWKKEKISA